MTEQPSSQLPLLVIAVATFAWTLYRASGTVEPISDRQREPFEVVLRVTTDAGKPVSGAVASINGRELGRTTPQGSFEVRVDQAEGSVIEIEIACPQTHTANTTAIRIALQTLSTLDDVSPRRRLERSVVCTPLAHTALLVVKASGAAFSPIIVGGRVAGITDADGVARFAYRLKPDETLKVQIDTSALPDLRPEAPEQTFAMPDHDAIFVFEQSFKAERPGRQRAAARYDTRPRAPYRIN